MKKESKFTVAPCRRGCGKMLTTLRRANWGLGDLKEKYELICAGCLTGKEHHEILQAMGKAIIKENIKCA